MWWGILTNQILDVSVGLCGWSPWVSAGLHGWSLQVVVRKINQSNFRHLHRSPRVVSTGLCGSPWVSVGGLHGSPWVSAGLHGWSLQVVVRKINQSNFRHLHRSPRVVSTGLCGSPWVSVGGLHGSPWVSVGLHRSLQVVSAGLHGWWWGKLTNQNLCQ